MRNAEQSQHFEFHLAISDSHQFYHCPVKNHVTDKAVNTWLTAQKVYPRTKQKNRG